MKQVTVEEALIKLESTTHYGVAYRKEILPKTRRDYRFNNSTIEQVMNEIVKNTNLGWSRSGDIITVIEKKADPKTDRTVSSTIVTGRVVDNKKEPLTGATIIVKGTGTGVVTDATGQFSIKLNRGETILVSFVGKITQEIVYNSQKSIDVVLQDSVDDIDDVVVTGMFTRKAQTYTGAVTTISKEQLLSGGNQNIITSLANVEPSVVIVENLASGSDPNATQNLVLRGQSTIEDVNNQYISDPNQPLFILDGFETTYEKIRDLDINLVESVTLLKDATAKAIWGSKAANGVIVVETRRPEGGKIRIRYTGNLNLEMPDLTSYNLTNAREKLQAEVQAGLYSSDSFSAQKILDEKYASINQLIYSGANTDWLSQPLRIGVGQKHSIYLEGGDNYMLYGVDLSYNNVQGVMKGSDRNTISGGVSLNYRTEKFMFRNKLSVDHNVADTSPWGDFSQYAKMNPYNRLYDDDGNIIQTYTYSAGGAELVNETNPIWNTLINTKSFTQYTDITENLNAEYRITQRLRVTGRFGLTYKVNSSDDFKPATHTDFVGESDVFKKGRYSKSEGKTFNLNGDVGASYALIVGKNVLTTNAQFTLTDESYDTYSTVAEGFPNDFMDHISFATQYLEDGSPSGGENHTRTVGGIISANYSYDNRYLLDFNYRLTGSSETGINNRWGHFWSVGGGWNVHKEAFLADNSFINMLKLRASLGYTGSQGFNTYDATATLKYYMDNAYAGEIGSYVVSLANPYLRWQSKYDRNVGVDFAIFGSTLSGSFNYYWATTESMLTNVTVPQSTGFTSYRENLGETLNKGWEASLSWRIWNNTEKRGFFSISASAAHNKNTLKKISESLSTYNDKQDKIKEGELTDNVTQQDLTTPSVRYVEGQSMNSIWAVRSLGIDPINGREIYQRPDGTVTYVWSAADQVVCGDLMPKINGNLGINAQYMNFGINVQLSYRLGGQIYNSTLVEKVENANIAYNVDQRVLTDRWQEIHDVARFKSITDQSTTLPTSRFVEDYNLLKLSSISISYDFRDFRFVQESFVQRLRLTAYVNDIATFSSVRNERGTSYPYSRNVSFSIQASF